MKVRQLRLVPPTDSPGDHVALQRVSAGDLAGLGVLYDKYASTLFLFIRRIAPNEDAEDVVQIVFLRVIAKAATFDGRHPTARNWLYGITVHVLSERRRSLARFARAMLTRKNDIPVVVEASAASRLDLLRGLNRLSTAKRVVLLLAEAEGFSCQEIAELLDIPVGTVWTRLHHARREMATLCQDIAT